MGRSEGIQRGCGEKAGQPLQRPSIRPVGGGEQPRGARLYLHLFA